MSAHPHTAGPWFVRPYARQNPPDIVSEHGIFVAMAHAFDADHQHPETLSNARLIAAAPELLQALRDCLTWIDERDPDHESARRQFERVIAKAEGK